MAHINSKTGVATLTLAESMVLASEQTQDGRDVDATRRAVREQAQPVADRTGAAIEVYACRRHGGCMVDVIEPSI